MSDVQKRPTNETFQYLRDRLTTHFARARWNIFRRVAAPFVSPARPIIIGGCPRSGTTLLRVMLDSHPDVCCGPEAYLFGHARIKVEQLAARFDLPHPQIRGLLRRARSQAEFISLFFSAYCEITGKQRWAEKTPKNVTCLDYIFRHFPEARFVHVLRDGRDTVCSLRTHPRYKMVAGKLVERGTRRPIANCARIWCREVNLGRRWRADPRYLEVRYEDLVLDPAAALRRLLEWLGESWDERVLHFHEQKGPSREVARMVQNPKAVKPIDRESVGRWQKDLTAEEQAQVEAIAGPLLAELGYTRSSLTARHLREAE